MKKAVFLIIVVILNLYDSFSQTQSNVSTPKGNPVTAYITPEDQSATRSYSDWYYGTYLYPQNTKITTYDNYSSTGRFNCHGYAWHMQGTLSSPRWIGYNYTTDEDIYMSDGSYVQVLNEMYPGKVSWGSGDHSAMTTSTPGIWISKWNRYPLFQHAWDNSLYGTNNLKYYVSTSITGSTSVLCHSSNRSFSVVSIPNASYSWNVGPGLSKSENGNSCTVTSDSYSHVYSWIEATITSPIGGGQNDIKVSPRLYFWIGEFENTVVTGTPNVCPGNIYTYEAQVPGGHSSNYTYSWTYPGNWSVYAQYDNVIRLYVPQYNPMYGSVRVSITNSCGTSAYSGITVYPGYCGRSFILYPNPATNNVSIELLESDQQSFISGSTDDFIYIYNSQGVIIFSTKLDGNKVSIPVSSYGEGTYIVELRSGKVRTTQQLIINR